MDTTRATPWQPDRRWADPLIALMALLALLAASLTLMTKQARAGRPADRASLQGRMMEPLLSAPRLLGARLPLRGTSLAGAQAQLKEPWDRALLSVLAAEAGDPATGRDLARAPQGPWGDRFRAAWAAAYDHGPLPDPAQGPELRQRLGNGYAAAMLASRLADREGGNGEAQRTAAREALLLRLAALGAFGLLVTGLGLAGVAVGIYLIATRKAPLPQPLPEWGLSGRAAALVLLAWFLLFFLAGNLAALLVAPFPQARWLAVPLGYGLHAAGGLALLCRAEGISFRELWRRLTPPPTQRALAWAPAFLGLAVALVMGLAMVLGPFLKSDQAPQRELVDLLRGLSGWAPTVAMFLVVAGLAPFFEETLFRGFLLPVLARRWSMTWALLASALLFGAIHLQPLGLPTLSALGLVLGLAMRRTGSLWTSILVHGCWNGAVFILMRTLAS